jgi:hypothetical protein
MPYRKVNGMMDNGRWKLLGILVVFLTLPIPLEAQIDSPSNIDSQCDELCAVPEKPWRSIPWELDLLTAQKLSVEQSKPIFIWAMDGHPLGCT